ncbi:MAG: GtrA family protein [Eubacteriales bacterium]|nr:GtrA family protein [Eubacteriales bacterium]
MLKKIYKGNREILSYLFWGGMTTVVSWVSYGLFEKLLKAESEKVVFFGTNMSIAIFLANVLSWICAILFAFVSNKVFVFQSKLWKKDVVVSEFGKFVSARVVTGFLEIIGVPILVSSGMDQSMFGVEGFSAKIIVSVAVVVLNYLFSKLFIFKKTKVKEAE